MGRERGGREATAGAASASVTGGALPSAGGKAARARPGARTASLGPAVVGVEEVDGVCGGCTLGVTGAGVHIRKLGEATREGVWTVKGTRPEPHPQ